jgi:hypothetical protein
MIFHRINYKLDVNGSINCISLYKNNIELDDIYLKIIDNYWIAKSNNIYLNSLSNVGIGNSQPLGTLHLGSTNSISDASIVISKFNINSIARNFKFGYDTNFNFVMCDFGDGTTSYDVNPVHTFAGYEIEKNEIQLENKISEEVNISTLAKEY